MEIMVTELSEDEQRLLRSLLAEDNKTITWLLTMTHKQVNAPPYDIRKSSAPSATQLLYMLDKKHIDAVRKFFTSWPLGTNCHRKFLFSPRLALAHIFAHLSYYILSIITIITDILASLMLLPMYSYALTDVVLKR
jgi:hypothetical protein